MKTRNRIFLMELLPFLLWLAGKLPAVALRRCRDRAKREEPGENAGGDVTHSIIWGYVGDRKNVDNRGIMPL
jgi:hypothetical protein